MRLLLKNRLLPLAGVVLMAVGLTSAPAQAQPAPARPPAGQAAPQVTQHAPPAACDPDIGWAIYLHGYWGRAKCGTEVIDVDWTGDFVPDEAFAVAPRRTIWHVWDGNGGWVEMPHHGRADFMGAGYRVSGSRVVSVWVNGDRDPWCSVDPRTGRWSTWRHC